MIEDGMDSGRRGRSRLLLEGVVILLSILIAFGLDAGWENAELSRALRRDLSNVSRELDENRQRVLYQLDIVTRIEAALGYLGEALATTPSPQVSVPDTIAWLPGLVPTLNASLGAIDALIASGRMEAIEDLDLAGRLAGLGGLIDDVVEEQLYAKEISLRFVVPYVGDVIRSTEHVRAAYFASERPVGQGLTYRTHVDFPNSTVIRGGLERMRVTYFASTFELQGLLEELDAIQELLGS